MPPGGGRATLAPLLFLDSATCEVQAFAQFADPKVLHFPARPTRGEGQSRSVALLCCCVGGTGRRGRKGSAGSVAPSTGVWVLGFTHLPPKIRRTTPLCLTCCGL